MAAVFNSIFDKQARLFVELRSRFANSQDRLAEVENAREHKAMVV